MYSLQFRNWKVGIASWSVRQFPLDVQMAVTAGLGLDWFEIANLLMPRKDQPALDPMRVRTLYEDYGLHADAVYDKVDEDIDRSRWLFERAKAAGFKTITTSGGGPVIYDQLEQLALEFDMRVALHNHGPQDKIHGYSRQVVAALQNRDARMGACVDVAWSMMSSEDPIAVIQKLGPRVMSIHIRDHREVTMESECTLGEGFLDLPLLLRTLQDLSFSGALSIETVINPENPLPDIQKHIAALQKAIKA
jgi:inosose dehydratase